MELTKQEAEKLGKAWAAVYEAYNQLEDLRPGGGFEDGGVDHTPTTHTKPKICKNCKFVSYTEKTEYYPAHAICKRPNLNLVSGAQEDFSCDDERKYYDSALSHFCGIEGKFYKEKQTT